MALELGPGEPEDRSWQVVSADAMRARLLDPERKLGGRPWVVAVDGRSGSGKSTLADRLTRIFPGSVIVHTDDIAWHHSVFDWTDLLIEGVLEPLRRGEAVRYRPPGWETHGRAGAIEIPARPSLILVEGVGSSRLELLPWLDRSIWVQSDFREAERRGIARDGGTNDARAFWQEWMSHENPFLLRDRPWDRASMIVSGMPSPENRSDDAFVVAGAKTDPDRMESTLPAS